MPREATNERHQLLQTVSQLEARRLATTYPRGVTTAAGIRIGQGYVPPKMAKATDGDGTKLQTALLRSRQRQHGKPTPRGNGRIRGALLAVAMSTALAAAFFYGGS